MVPYWLSRMELLLGEEPIQKLKDAHVLVVGLGGVGGICAEMVVRAGVGKLTIVDGDVVDLSNCNRQIPALHSTAGKSKAEVMQHRLLDINPELELQVKPIYLKDEGIEDLFRYHHFDYAVDCIDTLSPKVFFLKACLDAGVPVVSSQGAGGKIDPSLIRIADISETKECNLARYVRKRLKKLGISTGIKVVYSPEKVDESRIIVTDKAFPKKSLIGTISYMPALFGCTCASVVIRDLMNRE